MSPVIRIILHRADIVLTKLRNTMSAKRQSKARFALALSRQIFTRRVLGACAGGVAAYALIVNLFLLGILTAPHVADATPSGFVLCVTPPDSAGHSDSGSGTGTSSHCPLCISRGPIGGLPPQAADVFAPTVFVVRIAPVSVIQHPPPAVASVHHARGPPRSA